MKTFIQSHFNYCSLTWMFHSRILNNKINKLHERALRLVYQNENLTFQDLLELDNSVTVHQKVDIHEIVKNYETHPSILKIKENVNVESKFIFTDTTPNNLKDEICKLDPKKASTENDIPTKMLIASRDIVGGHLSKICNISKGDANYPLSLKLT